MSKEQKELIKSIWREIHVNYKWFSYFNSFNEADVPFSPLYVPADLHYGVVDMFYTNYQKCRTIEDKNFNSFLYSEVSQPRTILRGIKNDSRRSESLLLDEDYRILDDKEALKRLAKVECAICKPSIDSGGGKSISFLDSSMSEKRKLEIIKTMPDVVVQEIVQQHNCLSAFNASSLNTIRIVTFVTNKNDVLVLSAVLRMGCDNKRLDNAHSGGIFVGLHKNGYTKKTAHNLKGDSFIVHPTSGVIFDGYKIHGYLKCEEVVKRLAPKFYGLSRLISWDMAISQDEEPLLVEANMTFGGCDIPQISNGPLFGDYTETMIKEVFSIKKNRIKSYLI